jgi:hypothetical protein
MKHETLHTLRNCVSVDVYSHLIILLLLVIVNIKKHTFSELQPLLARLITFLNSSVSISKIKLEKHDIF